MKKNKQAISIVEAIVVTVVIALGLVGVYQIYNNSMKFLDGLDAKIQATQIAREGIEVVENIRDTNWLLFSSNMKECWNVLDYNPSCIAGLSGIEKMNGSYKIKREGNRWKLEPKPIGLSERDSEKWLQVGIDTQGFYTQDTNSIDPSNTYMNLKNFTREIIITPGVPLRNVNGDEPSSTNGMTVRSIVQWKDTSSTKRRKIELVNILTNYKQ